MGSLDRTTPRVGERTEEHAVTRRRIVVEVDATELDWCAEASKCSVEQFVAFALAEAMLADADDGDLVRVGVDGFGFVVGRR